MVNLRRGQYYSDCTTGYRRGALVDVVIVCFENTDFA